MRKSAPGVDNLTLEKLRELNPEIISIVFNIQLWKKTQLSCLNGNATTLIPKKSDGLDDAGNWRPVTLSSMLVRLLHRILANRVSSSIELNPRQKAFVPLDGCAQNTFVLDTLIRQYRVEGVGIDLAKAFD